MGELLIQVLQDNSEESFPQGSQFFWSVHHLGQSLRFDPNSDEDYNIYDKTAVLCGNFRVAVHCAKDFYLDNQALFWIPEKIAEARQERPEKVFFPALIPGLGNVLYKWSDPALTSPKNVQHYTKVFAPAHRDQTALFASGKITTTLFERYLYMHRGDGRKFSTIKTKKLNSILRQYSHLGDRCQRLHLCCRGATPARLEVVMTSDHQDSLVSVVKAAFETANSSVFPRLYAPEMLQNIPATQLEERIRLWTKIFGGKLNTLAGLQNSPCAFSTFQYVSF